MSEPYPLDRCFRFGGTFADFGKILGALDWLLRTFCRLFDFAPALGAFQECAGRVPVGYAVGRRFDLPLGAICGGHFVSRLAF
jgi:hypothetical protein